MKGGDGNSQADKNKQINGFIKDTTNKMKDLGTYKIEFDTTIRRYAEMQLQYEILNEKWIESGCAVTEPYTNKNGATNQRKTAIYLSIESLRKELLELENIFGLTPKGLKMIKNKGLEQNKKSALDRIFDQDV